MTNFDKYAKIGFNPCTISEIKNRLHNGYYNRKYHDENNNEMIFEDDVLASLIFQIDKICNIN